MFSLSPSKYEFSSATAPFNLWLIFPRIMDFSDLSFLWIIRSSSTSKNGLSNSPFPYIWSIAWSVRILIKCFCFISYSLIFLRPLRGLLELSIWSSFFYIPMTFSYAQSSWFESFYSSQITSILLLYFFSIFAVYSS